MRCPPYNRIESSRDHENNPLFHARIDPDNVLYVEDNGGITIVFDIGLGILGRQRKDDNDTLPHYTVHDKNDDFLENSNNFKFQIQTSNNYESYVLMLN